MSLRATLVGMALVIAPHAALAQKVPDALGVEWHGKKPCENLFEDRQIRVLRCTFPPGAKHLRHSHPGHLSYLLSGGERRIQDAKGVRTADIATDSQVNNEPVAWHELTNVGKTTLRYLIIERKYEPAPKASPGAAGNAARH